MRSKLAWGLLALLAALSVYGFLHEHLWSESLWNAQGVRRMAYYSVAFWALAAMILWRGPQYLVMVLSAAALAWAVWWAGFAPLVVLLFLASSFSLGRWLFRAQGALAVALGASLWMLVLWIAQRLPVPVNVPWLYAIAFAIPLAKWTRPGAVNITTRRDAAALAALFFVLGAMFFAALKPETSSDGLSMHLALPENIAHNGTITFEHRQAIWTLMPAGAEALYTGVYLLGGEYAAKLLDFSFLVLTCLLLIRLLRRPGAEMASPANAYLAAALFASTPLVTLVTGSLFVENVWAALLVAAVVALTEERPIPAAVLAGAAAAVKLIAVAFTVPIMLIVLWKLLRLGMWRAATTATLLALTLAAPPYVYAYAKSGNPVFPFENTIFRSPDYNTQENFTDERFTTLKTHWYTPYDMTFRSHIWIEGQGGAAGFQYFLLLLPALVLLRRRQAGLALFVAAVGTAIIQIGAPNLRYLYAAMPLATVAFAALPLTRIAPGLIALNLLYMPAAGYYDTDFAIFRKPGIDEYIHRNAPTRLIVERLNREAPGEPVAFFGTDAVAGLYGLAYTDTWHSDHFWAKVRDAAKPADIAAYVRSLGIHYIVAPATRQGQFEVVHKFLRDWLDLVDNGQLNNMGLYRLRATAIQPEEWPPLESGLHDDTEPGIAYRGAWLHDDQFAQTVQHSVSYAQQAGETAVFSFNGRAITYIYTRASNRGLAEVWIDGHLTRSIDLYAATPEWQSRLRLGDLAPGTHTFELRILGNKSPMSSGTTVDLDAIEVEP